jgi:signal transduction histidine kinase
MPMMTVAAALAAGWAVGLIVAAAVARHRRHRMALNRALHELRRPLQVLALASGGGGPARAPEAADLALAALEDLAGQINRTPRAPKARPVACRGLVESTLERWRGPAAAAHRSLDLRWRAGAATVMVDPCRAAQALDNLLANALEHGGLRVWMDVALSEGVVRISVCNTMARRPARRLRAGRDPGRGHGLRVVAAIAASHRGRFTVDQRSGVWIAVLELPLAAPPVSEAVVAVHTAGVRERLAATG